MTKKLDDKAVESAWKMVMTRFQCHPKPIFRLCSDNSIAIDLVYLELYDLKHFGIYIERHDIQSMHYQRDIKCIVEEKMPRSDFENTKGHRHNTLTMWQFKSLPRNDFKRIWLEAALVTGKELYESWGDKPFIKPDETIETLAIEYDFSHMKVE